MSDDNAIVIFDYSGSMKGERYNKCREACNQLTDQYHLYLFGSDWVDRGVVSSMPEFRCNSGTNITMMLNELYDILASSNNRYVYILTDGADSYDQEFFKKKYDGIKHRNHQVTVYDILNTNVKPLQYIFSEFGIEVVTNLDDIQSLITKMNKVMIADKKLIKEITESESSVKKLISNYEQLARNSEELSVKGQKLKEENAVITDTAQKALNSKAQQQIIDVSRKLKSHVEELLDHLHNLHINAKKIERLKLDLSDAKDAINILKKKIENENNSKEINQNKIVTYSQKIVDQEHERDEIEEKIAKVSICKWI